MAEANRMTHSRCCYMTGTMSIKYIKYLFNHLEALKRWNVHKTTTITSSHLLLLFFKCHFFVHGDRHGWYISIFDGAFNHAFDKVCSFLLVTLIKAVKILVSLFFFFVVVIMIIFLINPLFCLFQVMLAASYWSLLAPAIDMAEDSGKYGSFAFLPVAVGFTLGAAFVYFADLAMPLLVSPWHHLSHKQYIYFL